MLTEAEIEFIGDWRPITAEDALLVSRSLIIRCPKCHQRLCVHKPRADGRSRAHFEHWPHTGGCTAESATNQNAEETTGAA